ncbi:uncharacterized protein EDB91DRAFT_1081872 [Suillus paluster]|uniref:uncharacterized protein n=1 Tax=Suillus paluster TaxID=48578 RepID=UPI001B86CB5A|nr:uncharacterized protein EDB91DRAFT_1081872 [Suillus paluster]KAG1740791.1 hypothetical protein EDB91DRAFT_1081872 [Suillus paluster]
MISKSLPNLDAENDNFYGFSMDDSEDEVAGKLFKLDVARLPTIVKDDVTIRRKLGKAKQHLTHERGVIYMGSLPHSFYEDQLKAYLSQFGDCILLLSADKTARSKHYGFIEFDSASVTQIIANTMDNYLLMGHLHT